MFDRDQVQSGYDTETLLSEAYLVQLLLAQVEAGRLPMAFDIDGVLLQIHPPEGSVYRTTYRDGPWPAHPFAIDDSFIIELLPGDPSFLLGLSSGQDETELLVHTAFGEVRCWDWADRREKADRGFQVTAAYSSAFDRQGNRLAVAALGNAIEVWDVAAKTRLHELTGHSKAPLAVAWSADGASLISGGIDQTARVWDAASGAEIALLEDESGFVHSVALNRDGTRAATGDDAGTLRIWDVASGETLHVINDVGMAVRALVFTPDGLDVLAGSNDGKLTRWNVESGEQRGEAIAHEGPVLAIDVGPTGAEFATVGRDRKVKLWRIGQGFTELGVNQDHIRTPMVVRFSASGASIISGCESGIARVWNKLTASKSIEARPPFCAAKVRVSADGGLPIPLNNLINLDLFWTVGDDGMERDHGVRLSFARFDDETRQLLTEAGRDPIAIETRLREQLDQDLPLGFAAGAGVQRMRMRKFVDGGPRTLGIYINLALRAGPEPGNFAEARGSTADARNFRGEEDAIAFATSPELFGLLSADLKHQFAVETSRGSGEYHYPLHERPFDDSSPKVGKLTEARIGPRYELGLVTGALDIALTGEYEPAPGDPEFTLHLLLNPVMSEGGRIEWQLDTEVDISLYGRLLAALVGTVAGGLAMVFGPGALGGALIGFLFAEDIVEWIIADDIEENREQIASVLDALPLILPAASRRWDPFYETSHLVAAELIEKPIIDDRGFAFVAPSAILDRKARALSGMVIRDEDRTNNLVTGLRFRVNGFEELLEEFELEAPGADRRPFTRSDSAGEPDLVSLTILEVIARKDEDRILAPQKLFVKQIHKVGNQIDQLLCITEREVAEQRAGLLSEFRRARRAEIVDGEGDEIREEARAALLAELGREPTAAELQRRFDALVNARLAERIGPLQAAYEEGPLAADLELAVARILRFDLPPMNFISLINEKIVAIDGIEIRVRSDADGNLTFYVRDIPDGNPDDNLLSLPTYTPPYVPPA